MNADIFGILFSLIVMLIMIAVPLAIAGAAIFIVFNILKSGKQRNQDFRNFAAETGMTYIGADSFYNIPGYPYFRLFNLGSGHGRQIENAVRGATNGFQVSVFDFTYYVTFSTRKIRKQTVVMITSPQINLPLFSLQPQGKGLFQKMGNAFNNDINFPSNPSFSGKYLLYGHDQAGIVRAFDNRVLSHFDANDGFSVEGGGNLILIYRDEMLAAPNQLKWMLNEGLKIANLFARAL